MPLAGLYATAFLEGFSVLIIEIVGARAMAPFFGSSLMVWTAQITATLLFLAVGYRLGGFLSRQPSQWHLPLLFVSAGAWLIVFRWIRSPVMLEAGPHLGIAAGSFVSAGVLFGLPLLCLGGVSPVIIAAIDRARPGAGSAAGSLFFVNTLGGLAGGWATAFLVIPYLSIPMALASTGVLLLALAGFWAVEARGAARALLGLAGGAVGAGALVGLASGGLVSPPGDGLLLYQRQSSVGAIQVVDEPVSGRRSLLLDSSPQNDVDRLTFRSAAPYTDYFDELAVHFAPQAKRALALGLGAGVLPAFLARRGVDVTAVEIEPRIEEVARRFFGLPDRVRVEIADARSFLRRDTRSYDVVVLDVYSAENPPWHLLTVEAFQQIAARLSPGGKLMINTYTAASEGDVGISRLEAALLRVFPEAMVFAGRPDTVTGFGFASAILVAGEGLASTPVPAERSQVLDDLLRRARPARAGDTIPTDDWSDLDYVESGVRARYRQVILQSAPPFGDA